MQFTPPGIKILGLSPHILFTNIPFISTWYSPASQEFYILPFCFHILSISQTNALLGKGRDFYMAWSQRTGVDTQGSETNQWLSRYRCPSDSTAFCIFALSLCLWLQFCLGTWRRKQNKEKKNASPRKCYIRKENDRMCQSWPDLPWGHTTSWALFYVIMRWKRSVLVLFSPIMSISKPKEKTKKQK